MGRRGITSVDVLRAYIALLKEGRLPGPSNLRLQLGTGSYTTIAQHVQRLALRHPQLRPVVRRRKPRADLPTSGAPALGATRVRGWEHET